MDTPKYAEFMNPILQALHERGGALTNAEIVDAVATLMSLSEPVLERKYPGGENEVKAQIKWAKTYLKKLATSPRANKVCGR